MKTAKLALALLTIVTLGSAINPAYADQATIQETDQNAVITGNNNTINQQTIQINVQNGKSRRGSTGIVQRTQQNTDVLGNDNYSRQQSVQMNQTKEKDRGNHRGFSHKNHKNNK
jgi:hypothetical protein